MKENVIVEKSYEFAKKIVRLYLFLVKKEKEYVLSKQVLRSGTAIGALVREAEFGQSKADFINKLSIALKEANATKYWLMLLKDSGYITPKMYESLIPDVDELLRLLISSVKTAKKNTQN